MSAETFLLAVTAVNTGATIAMFAALWKVMSDMKEIEHKHRWHRHPMESVSSNRTGLPLQWPPFVPPAGYYEQPLFDGEKSKINTP